MTYSDLKLIEIRRSTTMSLCCLVRIAGTMKTLFANNMRSSMDSIHQQSIKTCRMDHLVSDRLCDAMCRQQCGITLATFQIPINHEKQLLVQRIQSRKIADTFSSMLCRHLSHQSLTQVRQCRCLSLQTPQVAAHAHPMTHMGDVVIELWLGTTVSMFCYFYACYCREFV